MTDFTDRVYLRLNNSADEISNPYDIVKKIWWFQDGYWAPQGFSSRGNSYLTLTEQNDTPPTEPNINLFEITSSAEPLLVTDRGLIVQKDIAAGGFVSSNQGEIWLGSGRDDQVDVPKIILSHSDVSRLQGGGQLNVPAVPVLSYYPTAVNGRLFIHTFNYHLYKYVSGTGWVDKGPSSDYSRYFDTLYLTKANASDLAHLNLGNLTATQLKVKSTNSVFAVTAGDNGANQDTYLIPQNPSQGGLGLGTTEYPFKWVDATYVFTNNINSLSGGAITVNVSLDYSTVIHGGGSSGDAFKIGDDIYLVDVNEANTVCLQGAQTRANAKIYFGSDKDTNLYRSGPNQLKTDDSFIVGAYGSISSAGDARAAMLR